MYKKLKDNNIFENKISNIQYGFQNFSCSN